MADDNDLDAQILASEQATQIASRLMGAQERVLRDDERPSVLWLADNAELERVLQLIDTQPLGTHLGNVVRLVRLDADRRSPDYKRRGDAIVALMRERREAFKRAWVPRLYQATEGEFAQMRRRIRNGQAPEPAAAARAAER